MFILRASPSSVIINYVWIYQNSVQGPQPSPCNRELEIVTPECYSKVSHQRATPSYNSSMLQHRVKPVIYFSVLAKCYWTTSYPSVHYQRGTPACPTSVLHLRDLPTWFTSPLDKHVKQTCFTGTLHHAACYIIVLFHCAIPTRYGNTPSCWSNKNTLACNNSCPIR